MNEYMPDQNYTDPMGTDNSGANVKQGIKYAGVILTILLAVILIFSIVMIMMFARISKEVGRNSRSITDINKSLSSVEDEMSHISRTVDDILEQGCTGNSGSNTPNELDPYDPDPFYPEYGVEKPVLYIYNDDGAGKVHVELTLKDSEMVSMWPAADAENTGTYSWDVNADTDGKLTAADGYEYSYIFWEASDYGDYAFDKGACVAGSDTAQYLRSTLSQIGLTPKEYNEFIVYWLPRMQGNAYNLISFAGIDPGDAYNDAFALSVTGEDGNEADSVLRVMMVWKGVDEAQDIEPQEFGTFERKGLTVVEWGGTELR